jgi:isorenieratene synthase
VSRLFTFGRDPRTPLQGTSDRPDWQQASPAWIEGALRHALAKPSGGWYVVDSVRALDDRPSRRVVRGQSLVVWRTPSGFRAGPDTCPHLGASLSTGRVEGECIVCPWHGLALGDRPHGAWRPLVCHDDGVLLWVRLPPIDGADDPLTDAPILAPRPRTFLDAVIRREARCEPEDVIANRLDPWHGVHFHPHSFARLQVIDQDEESVTVRVVYRLVGRVGIEVDARFHCPEPRTIVMTIVDGEGIGSVVETHVTPIAEGRSVVIEATLATSDRRGFGAALAGARWLRPLIGKAADRLWIEDAAYAERRYAVRRGEAR